MISGSWCLWSREVNESENLGFVCKGLWVLASVKVFSSYYIALESRGWKSSSIVKSCIFVQKMQFRPFMKDLQNCISQWKNLYHQKISILVHLRKLTCVLKARLSLFLQCIKTVFLAAIKSAQRTSELCGLSSPFTAFLLPLPNPNSFLRRSLSHPPKLLICQYFSLDLAFTEEGCSSLL